jgi:monoamine oxidase
VTEAGGEWVASRQKRILALCKTFGIQKFPTYDKGKASRYPFSRPRRERGARGAGYTRGRARSEWMRSSSWRRCG